MVNEERLPKRIDEARALARFAKIIRDTGGVFEIQLPGHQAKRYRVILRWVKTGKDWILQSECGVETHCGHMDCKGNQFNVCYHTIAAVIAMAESHKKQVSFAATEAKATKLVNIKNRAVRLLSKQSFEYIWVVI